MIISLRRVFVIIVVMCSLCATSFAGIEDKSIQGVLESAKRSHQLAGSNVMFLNENNRALYFQNEALIKQNRQMIKLLGEIKSLIKESIASEK
jgi:hypothetical protein